MLFPIIPLSPRWERVRVRGRNVWDYFRLQFVSGKKECKVKLIFRIIFSLSGIR